MFSLTVMKPGEFEKRAPEQDSLAAELNGTNSIPLINFDSSVRFINNYVNYLCTCAFHQHLTNPLLL